MVLFQLSRFSTDLRKTDFTFCAPHTWNKLEHKLTADAECSGTKKNQKSDENLINFERERFTSFVINVLTKVHFVCVICDFFSLDFNVLEIKECVFLSVRYK